MMAAALAKEVTTLVNCAREPEVEELGRVLNKMGAVVDGAGTDVIHIEGRDALEPSRSPRHRRSDRGGHLHGRGGRRRRLLRRAPPGRPLENLEVVVAKLRQAGVEIDREGDAVRVARRPDVPLRPVNITTAPHPGTAPTCRPSSWSS